MEIEEENLLKGEKGKGKEKEKEKEEEIVEVEEGKMDEDGLPVEEVLFKSYNCSLNHHHIVAISSDGLIYTKEIAKEDKTDKFEDLVPKTGAKWKKIGDGLPQAGFFTNGHKTIQWPSGWIPFGFQKPKKVIEIDCDGDGFVALGEDRTVYWMRWKNGFKEYWQARWGLGLPQYLPAFLTDLYFDAGPPGWAKIPTNILSWGLSRRYRYNHYYEDMDGVKQPTDIGVTTLYVLYDNGYEIKFIDPWLCPELKHRVETPLRNRFKACAMSVAASTLFIIGEKGDMYTRLVDFDTLGHNPYLSYTWKKRWKEEEKETEDLVARKENKKEIEPRALPNEDWLKQPAPLQAHKLTKKITILQRGKGNAARELRVIGQDKSGDIGFFYKPIFGAVWNFEKFQRDTNYFPKIKKEDWISWTPPQETPLEEEEEGGEKKGEEEGKDLGPSWEISLEGKVNGGTEKKEEGIVKTNNFSPYCSPCLLELEANDSKLPLTLHLLAPEEDDEQSHITKWNGVMVVKEEELSDSSLNIYQKWIKNEISYAHVFVSSGKLKIQSKELNCFQKIVGTHPLIDWELSLAPDMDTQQIQHVLEALCWSE